MSDQDDNVIHIHEDDWGRRNLYPIAARNEAAGDLDAAREADKRNRAPSLLGWTDVHIIRPPSIDYRETGLTLAVAATALEPIMPRVKRFYATATAGFGRKTHDDPYGSYEENAWCFGRGMHCYIKLDGRDGLIEHIWFDLSSSDPADAIALRRSIEAIDRLTPSVVTDYVLDAEGPVADPDFLSDYFQLLTRE